MRVGESRTPLIPDLPSRESVTFHCEDTCWKEEDEDEDEDEEEEEEEDEEEEATCLRLEPHSQCQERMIAEGASKSSS